MKQIFIALFGLSCLSGVNAAEQTLVADSGAWSTSLFGDAGTPWEDTFTFTISQTSMLTVTDGWQSGDIFEVFSNGSSLGKTSFTNDTSQQVFANYDAAVLSPSFSTRIWTFLAGTYEISGIAVVSPWWTETGGGAGGIAALRLDSLAPVPAPAALWLLMPPTLFLLGIRRRVKNSIKS